jgi:hypothetical protein
MARPRKDVDVGAIARLRQEGLSWPEIPQDALGRCYGLSRARRTRVNESPLYLLALKDGVIRDALSYSVEGKVLHYVDLDSHSQGRATRSGRPLGQRRIKPPTRRPFPSAS